MLGLTDENPPLLTCIFSYLELGGGWQHEADDILENFFKWAIMQCIQGPDLDLHTQLSPQGLHC